MILLHNRYPDNECYLEKVDDTTYTLEYKNVNYISTALHGDGTYTMIDPEGGPTLVQGNTIPGTDIIIESIVYDDTMKRFKIKVKN